MKISLPRLLKSYQRPAERAIKQGAVREIEFSGTTYQVRVHDNKTAQDAWVFMQLQNNGDLKDGFCSCNHLSEEESCLHIAIAYLSLFHHTTEPLHTRFSRSLWNQLCRLYQARLGDQTEFLKQETKDTYICQSGSGKKIFELIAISAEACRFLDKIIFKRKAETEETSLKFSNLSHDDLSLWREGNPSPQLRYDLSFWSDLAKWLMNKQEEGQPYQITYKYSKQDLPNWFQIDFSDIHIGFYISEANLPLIIDALQTVESPLAVYYPNRIEIAQITYDKKEQVLHIEEKKKDKLSKIKSKDLSKEKKGISIDGWLFIPHEGFYANDPHELLKRPLLYGEEIAQTLTEHPRLIASLIVDCHVQVETTPLSYQLYFDNRWNLHITTYLFEPGDLTIGDSWLIDNWAYLDNDGFYQIEDNRFHDVKWVIPFQQVSEFVTQNRSWLNNFEGFQTHVRSIECQLTYQITPENRLLFTRIHNITNEKAQQQDFGAWIYLQGAGFYSKSASSFGFLLRPGVSLSAEQIPLFIQMNRDELALIPHFFTSCDPIDKLTFSITLTEKQKIKVVPTYSLIPAYKNREIQIFDNFIYIKEEGFHALPSYLKFPEKFLYPFEIGKKELTDFIEEELKQIAPYASFIDPRLKKPKEMRLVSDLIETVNEKGRGWYRFRLYYQTEEGLVSALTIASAIKKKLPYLFSKAGCFDLKDQRFNWLQNLPKERCCEASILMNALEFMRLYAYDPIEILETDRKNETQQSKQILEYLTQLHTPDQPDIDGLLSHLRPYQEVGLQWLWFLYRQRLSGLLCDDMGLGKTHQAMALLAAIGNLYRSYAEGTAPHFLIVCPTSVIYHWQEKLRQFLPGMSLYTFYGTNRSIETFQEEHAILLTSYGILRNERELLAKISFEAAIFDEIQLAKNQCSRVYEALTQISAQMKIGLTGTPIENHLRELKSLFDITLPSYMPGEKEYRELFIKPIEKENDLKKKNLLKRLIHPFVMRRKKDEVLKDLPEKTEELAYCDLHPTQQILYSEVLEQRKHRLLEELHNEKNAIPYLHVFALLSSLKQICNHPAVYLKKPEDYLEYSSGKWNLFLGLLREARESNQKVVVFSQYLHMLDIIQIHLKEKHIGFASLRGMTQNRKEQLQLFNQDPDCEVFVGSLHAAGLGVDLTAGSVVIHYDRWWNAARENQATDRVHRIGQTRGVQVFKLITKGTFEEKIDAMIAKKGKLLEDVVGIDEQNVLKTFSRTELIELLELVKTPAAPSPSFNDMD